MKLANEPVNILRIDASARREDSVSRDLGDTVIERLLDQHSAASVSQRDLADPLPLIDEHWVGANFTPADERTDVQRDKLALSDTLIGELKDADVLVMTAPIYNFSVPAAMKAWIDLVCRAGLTFRYTPDGPVGLLEDRPVYLVMASGGVPFGSEVDFASGYLRQVLRFIGISDVRFIGAERVAADPAEAQRKAMEQIDRYLPHATSEVA
jgi:FMN-dependent NADH-azoreductase